MSFDPNLGHRFKANTKPFRLLHRLPGKKKRFKEVKIKNFFEIQTDGYGFVSNKENQVRNYKELAKSDSTYRILVLGNSVTAGYGVKSGAHAWPSLLENKLNEDLSFLPEKFSEVVVINSASLGSQIDQELRRLQDETIFLNPHHVISLSGGLIDYEYRGNPVDISLHEQQQKVREKENHSWFHNQNVFLPCVKQLIKELTSAHHAKNEDILPYQKTDYISISAADNMLQKIKQLHGICEANQVHFDFFLQPVMGIGEKPLTKQEQNHITYFERYFFEKNWDEYVNVFKRYIAELRNKMPNDAAYIHDIMNIFEETEKTVYCDPRHQNELGHSIIAEHIEQSVRNTAANCTSRFKTKRAV